jgi:MoaA/NifB/PqqE/SkfB family radical SAM enzyme
MLTKLWLYTNYDCNLRCSYCVAESHPRAARRALPLDMACRAVDEGLPLGIDHFYFTGGEPFLLDDIYAMLAYASARAETTVLTNATILRGIRLERLSEINHPNLVTQVSLDGARPEHHDPYRGAGAWQKTVDGIRLLLDAGLRVRLATTETPANAAHLPALADFRRSLGIADDDHVVRPLARRGFATEGIEVEPASLVPEVTLSVDGVFWHPLASPGSVDMLVTRDHFPLAAAIRCIEEQHAAFVNARAEKPRTVT